MGDSVSTFVIDIKLSHILRRAADLGVDCWYADALGEPEAVALDQLSGHFILAPISVGGRNFWITVAFNHVSSDSIHFFTERHYLTTGNRLVRKPISKRWNKRDEKRRKSTMLL